jgi:hypothetical protein
MNNKNTKTANAEVVGIYLMLGHTAFMARVMALNYEAAVIAQKNLSNDPLRH